MKLRYSTTAPDQDEFDSLPRVPIILAVGDRSLVLHGLVDSGATVSVLPYRAGLELGLTWDDSRAKVRLAGNLGSGLGIPVAMLGTVGEFKPARLVFVWVPNENIPLILGQTNFFLEFEVHFYRSRLEFEVFPRSD